MSGLDRHVVAEISAAVERFLKRVEERLPAEAEQMRLGSDATDVVVLNLWQATQAVIDLALAACTRFGLGTPSSYGDAFRRLGQAGRIDTSLTERLVKPAGFRNLVAHRYGSLDLVRLHRAGKHGPADLRAFLRCVATWAGG